MKAIEGKRIFLAYEFGLVLKTAQAVLEIITGVLFSVIGTNTITTFVLTIAHAELSETPRDLLANILAGGLHQFSSASKFFIVFYLLSHGIIKLIILIGLFKQKKWAYPAALIGFGGLILYQLYALAIGYSLSLLIFTIMDIVILGLIVREHYVPKRYIKF